VGPNLRRLNKPFMYLVITIELGGFYKKLSKENKKKNG
jgi:hypothetical protein